jgi:hypothetical protein
MRLADVTLWLFFTAICAALAFTVGRSEGRKSAYASAYKTNPPSQELELTCLGLWMGEQNKKYWEKTK